MAVPCLYTGSRDSRNNPTATYVGKQASFFDVLEDSGDYLERKSARTFGSIGSNPSIKSKKSFVVIMGATRDSTC